MIINFENESISLNVLLTILLIVYYVHYIPRKQSLGGI